jgi:zinc protease
VNIRFSEADLPNGLHVILHEDHDLPIVAVNLWYHVGSKNEREGKTGFAHLFEHLMFQGSAHVPANAHFKFVQEAGGTLNASTSFDRTNYYETLPSHQYELGLWLEADRMRSLNISHENLENQRSVVIEERRSRYDNQPYGTMFEELFRHAYKMQPYKWPTIGSIADISAAGLDDVKEFHEMFYKPGNASLCIAGDFNSDSALKLIESYFGDIPNVEYETFRPFVHEPPQHMQVRNHYYDVIPLPALIMGFHIPDQTSDEFMACEILARVLASGKSSRLYRNMVYEAGIAQSVMTFAYGLELPGLMIFRAVARPGVGQEPLEDAIWREIRDIASHGPTGVEVEKAQNRMTASVVNKLHSMQSRADLLNTYHVQFGQAGRLNGELDAIQRVTAEQVREAAERYLTEANSTVLYYLPYPKS